MDIFEKLFEKVSQREKEKIKKSIQVFDFEKNEKYLVHFANSLTETKKIILLSPSQGFVGFSGNVLFLPEMVYTLDSKELNKRIYQNLILLSVAAKKLQIQQDSGENLLAKRLEFLKHLPKINQYLDKEFPNYQYLQNEIYQKLAEKKKTTDHFCFSLWQEIYLSRSDAKITSDLSILKKLKANEPVPDYMLASLPCIESKKAADFLTDYSLALNGKNKDSTQVQTELKKKNNGEVEYVDLNQQQQNPVTHSFEKMETADEYQGGYRFDSGDDELKEHQKALEELSLTKVTRGGESAQSVYSAEGLLNLTFKEPPVGMTAEKGFSYPEWDVKKSIYKENHCYLKESILTGKVDTTLDFKKDLLLRHRAEIVYWQKKIASIINYPLWKNRQLDGEEVDYDAFLRDYPSLLQKQNVQEKWYAKKIKSQQTLALNILFDQSMSSESWVENERVIDVIKAAVGMMGIIFDELLPQIEVAGTYSETRHHCHYHIYKEKDESWEQYYLNSQSIEAKGYTRLGPAIRHAALKLRDDKADKKLLILMTDGKPTDLDGYEGQYGISDVKKACSEAESFGILPFALTVDREAKQFFPKMFNQYKLLNKPEKLPQELYQIIFKLLFAK